MNFCISVFSSRHRWEAQGAGRGQHGAERSAQCAVRRARSAERGAQSAERGAQSAEHWTLDAGCKAQGIGRRKAGEHVIPDLYI